MNMLKITKEAIKAARRFYENAPTEEVGVFYSASKDSPCASIVVKYMQIEKHAPGKIKNEFYYVNRTMAFLSVAAIMNVLNEHGVKCEVKEAQEWSHYFVIMIDPEEIKENVIHTMKD